MTRFARPAGSPLTAFTVCPTGCRQLSTPVGASHPPGVCNIRKKSPYFRTSSSLNMAVRGGLTRFARPAGSPLTAFTVCPTGCRQLSNPGRGFSSPRCVQYTKKKPVLSYELFFKYGGEGGIRTPDTLPYTHFPGVLLQPLGHLTKLSNPGRGFSSPRCVQYTKKKPVLSYELFFKYGGEGGIRTPDTLPYTHFPGVLLQPLGHLTKLSFLSCWNGR